MSETNDQRDRYVADGLSDDEVRRQEQLYGPLTDSVRDLVRVTVLSDAGDDDVARAKALIDEAAGLLGRSVTREFYGVRFGESGRKRDWGNAAVGLRNAIAPPLDPATVDGVTSCEVDLAGQYEGPAGLVHGGVSALLLDQILGEAALAAGVPGMTGTLTVRYRRPTPLGRVRLEGRVDRTEGVKTYVTGSVSADGAVCVEAEGIFIMPRWARETGEAAGDAVT